MPVGTGPHEVVNRHGRPPDGPLVELKRQEVGPPPVAANARVVSTGP